LNEVTQRFRLASGVARLNNSICDREERIGTPLANVGKLRSARSIFCKMLSNFSPEKYQFNMPI